MRWLDRDGWIWMDYGDVRLPEDRSRLPSKLALNPRSKIDSSSGGSSSGVSSSKQYLAGLALGAGLRLTGYFMHCSLLAGTRSH